MNKEYVEREIVMEMFKQLYKEPHYQHEGEDYYSGICQVVGEFVLIPAADVEPVVHGEWIYDRTYYEADECYCSLCNQLMTTARGVRMKHCPNCGAKMDGGKCNG